MDQGRFQEAQAAYDAGDFRSAAKGFLASAGRGSVGNGVAYHMAGNALMRLRRHQDAVTVYGHALRDETYDKRGAVHANVGAAYVSLGEYAEAAKAYEAALDEQDYTTPYKAYQGMAGALVERGKIDEAAAAYRKAALDQSNPDPGKALVNLGLCFMALGRPADAAEAYKAALGFDQYEGRGKALANLGQAYATMGEYEEAVRAFEKATQLHAHVLSPAARRAYDDAVAHARPRHETVDGWETGEIDPIRMVPEADPNGWATGELQSLTGNYETGGFDAVAYASSDPTDRAAEAADALGFGDENAVENFYALTEDEMKTRDRELRRAERGANSGGRAIRIAVTAVVVVVLLGALVGAGYYFGFGWPTQTTTVNAMLGAYSSGQPVERYWVAVPAGDVDKEMAKIPPVKSFAIDSVRRGPTVSRAVVTVTPQKGAALHYVVTLSREGVGWKVNGVDNNWSSAGE